MKGVEIVVTLSSTQELELVTDGLDMLVDVLNGQLETSMATSSSPSIVRERNVLRRKIEAANKMVATLRGES